MYNIKFILYSSNYKKKSKGVNFFNLSFKFALV